MTIDQIVDELLRGVPYKQARQWRSIVKMAVTAGYAWGSVVGAEAVRHDLLQEMSSHDRSVN